MGRLTNADLLKSKGVVEIKKGTEYLQKKTLEMRREVEIWQEYCSSQYSRD
jgi:hypothetical protein